MYMICSAGDGAAVIKKVGKFSSCKQQLCLARAIHLAFFDLLYKKPQSTLEKESGNDCNSENLENTNLDDKQLLLTVDKKTT